MLANTALRPTSPSIWLSHFLGIFTSKRPEYPVTHGTARYIKSGDTAIHEQTELSLQPGLKEHPEAFMWRVWGQAEDGDSIEYRLRDGKVSAATITRKHAQALRMGDAEPLSDFVARVKEARHKNMPRA